MRHEANRDPSRGRAPDGQRAGPEPVALTVDQVVARLGIGRSLLYELWARGEGPRRVRIGRRVLVTPAALAEWLAGLDDGRSAGALAAATSDPAATQGCPASP